MSIVRESLIASKGTIAIETWPQKGTTFRIRVPLPFADLGRYIEPATELSIAPSSPTLKVLIVDDSPSVRLMTSRTMQGAGWQAHTAKNGIDALEKLVEMSKLPDVILTDIEMPVMGGYEFIAALRDDESLKEIPVVFVSSRMGVDDRAQAIAAGAVEYVTKPYDERKLVELVDRLAHTHDQVTG
jgi:chemosensory pili system protein ChpA (sensor histidine kinase/response regulator)